MKARCGCGDRFSGGLYCQTCGTFIWSTTSAACGCPADSCGGVSRPGKRDGTSDLDLPREMDDRAWGCSMCDEYSAEVAAAEKQAEEAERLRAVWFAENSAARAALGRVRELCNEWAAAGGTHRRNADLIRAAIDGEGE